RSSRCRLSIPSSSVYRGRTPRNNATSPRPDFRSTMTVAFLLRRASSTPQFTATVVVPAPPFAPSRRPAYRALEDVLGWRPDEKLVRAGAHRLKDEIGIAGQRDDKNAGAWRRRAQPFDARHRGGRISADVDDHDVGRRV